MIIPDKNWCEAESKKREAKLACPYANAYQCPRYYESLSLLSQARMISAFSEEKDTELALFWERTLFSGLCDEEIPSITKQDMGPLHSVSCFCPEVSFKFLNYYADYMYKYVDDIDKDYGYQRAERDGLENDWRYVWSTVRAKFYLDCEMYERVELFNQDMKVNYLTRLHPNIVLLVSRMDLCLDEKDSAGAQLQTY